MLDFYADWCIACKEMEHFTFSRSDVHAALADAILLQADVTANDETDQALMKRFDISERDQMKHSANINFSPTDRTTYGVYYNFVYDDYDTSQLGLQNSQRHDVTFDWMYTPSDATTLNIYYTYENIDTEQLNQEFSLFGACNAPTIPACNWTADHNNKAHTAAWI